MTDDLYIGLMSGTSLDGIDTVLVSFKEKQPTVLQSQCFNLPTQLQQEIQSLVNIGDNELERLAALDVQLGHVFADAVQQLLEKAKIKKEQVSAIGSHGQTIRHWPQAKYPTTLQLADANIIAETSGIRTVADFRRRDIAAGGQGAPLVPAFHQEIFRDKNINRVILNLGGIANVTVLAADQSIAVTGFDTGPANTLMNQWISLQQNQAYDEEGKWAASGQIDEALLERLLNDDYFNLAPPKSTGTEYFSASWLEDKLAQFTSLHAQDVQASLAAFTAITIRDAIIKHVTKITPLDEIIVCGGGVHNDYLLMQLRHALPEIKINSSEEYGIDPDYVEATAFAWLAKQTIEGKPGNIPEVTGAKHKAVLGAIYSV